MPDRCLVHGCSNRSDMNAGISAHFSPTVTSERDTWLRFVHTHRANLNQVESLWWVCSSPFRGGMFFKSVSHGRLLSSAYSWLNSYNTEDRARETIFQTTTQRGKPCSILSKLQYCVSIEVLFFIEVSYMFFPSISAICKYIFK